jgi:glycosyltransferase involved in cell wall biosynthesis
MNKFDPVDILHLTFRPPFTTGSYNRLVGMQLERFSDLRQAAISYWDGPLPDGAADEAVSLVSSRRLSPWRKLYLRAPERLKKHQYHGVSGREGLTYLWGILELLPQLKPKVVVCYENYHFGQSLRRVITWPCRLVLNQQGLSYHLPASQSMPVYSLRSFDAVWVLTRAAYRFDRYRQAAYEPMVKVIPNWIDMDRFSPATPAEKQEARARWGLPADRPIVLWLSRLVPKKGAHAVVQSWARVAREIPNALLWIVGGGDQSYQDYLRRLAEASGVADSVILQGAVAPTLTDTCYKASDVYVFPTLFSGEGFGLSLLEGLACGLACAASDHKILRELYPAEVVRIVEDPNLEDAFAEPLAALLRDAGLRARMGQLGRAFAAEHYHHDKVMPQLAEFYRRQMSLAGGGR